jgi:glycosyltransferase involved in cell wall biosynthesis
MKKVLVITYYWPPSGGAGVQRWLRFSKYLPLSGWEPVILTVDPKFAAYPAIDNSLENEISPDLRVYKTKAADYFRFYNKDKGKIPSAGFASDDNKGLKSKILRFIRGNFFIPDPRKGWNNHAFKRACEIIERENIKHLITTSPPHSTQLIGLKLKEKFPELNWIADLRDPWTDIYYYDKFYPTFISKFIDRRFEKKVLYTSDKIITVGGSLKGLFVRRIPAIAYKTEVITNGFDDEDFRGLNPTKPGKFTVSYIGTLSDVYPVDGLLHALNNLKNRNIVFLLKFVGTISPSRKEIVLSKIDTSSVEFLPYVRHGEAIRYMAESSLLILIIPEHKSNKSIITGKIFEYIASGRPVMCLGPLDGDAAEIINSSGAGGTFDYTDHAAIEEFMIRSSFETHQPDNDKISKYSGRVLTGKIVELLES